MSLKDDSDLDRHDGWYGAALVFAAGFAVALLLMGVDWRPTSEGDALALNAANTRPLLMMPMPLR